VRYSPTDIYAPCCTQRINAYMLGLEKCIVDGPKVRDVVLPVFTGKWDKDTFQFKEVSGTTFLIEKRGMALTAAHFVDQIMLKDSAVGVISSNSSWIPVHIINQEKHPTEDVAVIQLASITCPSWMVISSSSEHQACNDHSWGYPIAVAESGKRYEDGLQTPDLVFTTGYVRRKISKELPISIYRGSAFYELSRSSG